MNKPESGFRFIGQPMPRNEDARLVIGQGRFTDDFDFPRQTYAAMVRSPHAHARIVSIDKRRALALPDVLGVFTGADCLADGLGPIPHDPLPKTRDDMKLSGPGGGEVFIGPHLLLPLIKVRNLLSPEQVKTWCPEQELPYFRQMMPGRRPMGPTFPE